MSSRVGSSALAGDVLVSADWFMRRFEAGESAPTPRPLSCLQPSPDPQSPLCPALWAPHFLAPPLATISWSMTCWSGTGRQSILSPEALRCLGDGAGLWWMWPWTLS